MTPYATATRRRPTRGRQPVDVDQLARRILASCARDDRVPAGVFPSEREIARELGVTRHAVRSSMDYLAQQGAVQRLPGGGAVRVSQRPTAGDAAADGRLSLRCINFLQGPAHLQGSLQWLMQEYLIGYTEVLEFHDLKTRFLYWADGRTDFQSMFWPQAAMREQGCVLLSRREPALLQWLNDQQVPYVMQTHAAYDDAGLPPHHRVYVNKIGGAFDAVRHLLDLGHRRIGFVGVLPSNKGKALVPDFEGWQAAQRCAGLTPSLRDAITLDTQELEVALGPCREYLSRPDRPTAVFGGNGAAAAGLYVAAQELGLRVPRDISIIGFDANITPRFPQLSVVEIPRHQLGHQTVDLLLKVTRERLDPVQPEIRVLQCTLRLNGSTAAPAT